MTGIEQILMAVAVLCALLATGAILFWMLYRARKKRPFNRGMVCLEKWQYSGALYYFGLAELGWGINIAHKTPRTILKDLDRLDMIIVKVAEAAAECGHIIDIDRLRTMIEARKEIWSNRKYLKFGSHSLKNAILERDREIVDAIEEMRSQIRSIYPRTPPE